LEIELKDANNSNNNRSLFVEEEMGKLGARFCVAYLSNKLELFSPFEGKANIKTDMEADIKAATTQKLKKQRIKTVRKIPMPEKGSYTESSRLAARESKTQLAELDNAEDSQSILYLSLEFHPELSHLRIIIAIWNFLICMLFLLPPRKCCWGDKFRFMLQ
jgi:hypothetical protein